VHVDGRISALLELGAGFNPEFTGRENVFFQGAIMGLSPAQMSARFDTIAAFADIGDFIDQPVRTYSSGMFVRLAFSVAISVDPDILVVDEALSVGDSKFQAKCASWLRYQRNKGVAVLLVSHDANLITSLCDRVLLIDKGHAVAEGVPAAMTAAYHQLVFGNAAEEVPLPINGPTTRYGTDEAQLLEWGFLDGEGRSCSVIESGKPFRLYMRIQFLAEVHDTSYGFAIKNRLGTVLWGQTSISQGHPVHHGHPGDIFEIGTDGRMWLAAGDYFVSLGAAHVDDGGKIDFVEDGVEFKVIGPDGIFSDSLINMQTCLTIVPAGLPAEESP
jgi:energy-coupling factor transporter ATP-binding protein EcfA2